MASFPQTQVSTLDRLSNDILRLILDLAMVRDSPFYIDDPILGLDHSEYIPPRARRPVHDRTL
jgi:hypothetical protein